jgi:tRNA threonylcarbamoyladenosine biosynthesis protein TsaE
MQSSFLSNSEIETFDIARKISKEIKQGDILLFEGPLGAGKSIFIRGILNGLGVNEVIPSPTFTIVNEYKISNGKIQDFSIYHFDFYRINNPYELYEIGFEEYIYSGGISLIEWASKAEELIPDNTINIDIKILSDNEREISINWKNRIS